ncbi:hypothetical protein TNIN_266951 [Trichonephila inaurata madagascariensis]|uniref:Uncharacterized protein n=1 Tax=Trichonephila inaurata madagascariensis TaxID=2747483 RepID=A0A8X7C988_9ARAC|nr:hypothetical protein TNIN_266951 [Trichonephila inaurata madagascariensis]
MVRNQVRRESAKKFPITTSEIRSLSCTLSRSSFNCYNPLLTMELLIASDMFTFPIRLQISQTLEFLTLGDMMTNRISRAARCLIVSSIFKLSPNKQRINQLSKNAFPFLLITQQKNWTKTRS